MKAVSVLGALLVVVTVLTLLCIVVPLAMDHRAGGPPGQRPLAGLLRQHRPRVHVRRDLPAAGADRFPGHPTYSLSVVLFSLLVSSGVGSYLSSLVEGRGTSGPAVRLFLLLLARALRLRIREPGVIRGYRSRRRWCASFS